MPDRTNPANWPNARGPWPEVTGLDQLYDHGRWWCASAAGHPDPEGDGYPDATIHPADECRTAGLYLDDVVHDLDGPRAGLEAFAAQRFSFGQARVVSDPARTRIVLEFFDEVGSQPPTRYSLAPGECLLLARWLGQLVDLVGTTGAVTPPWGTPQSVQ